MKTIVCWTIVVSVCLAGASLTARAADVETTDGVPAALRVDTPSFTADEWYRCLTFSNRVNAGAVMAKGPRESLDALDTSTPTTLIESIVANKHPVRVKVVAQSSDTRREFEMELLDKVMNKIVTPDDDQKDVQAFRQFAMAMIDHRCKEDSTMLHVDANSAYVVYTPSEQNYKFPQGQKPPFVRYDFNNSALFWKIARALLVEMQRQ